MIVSYLLADMMFGCLARLTGSILPGFVIHALGLAVFFAVIWPGDRSRGLISAGGPNPWFWTHAGQVLLAIPAIFVFLQLAKRTARYRQAGPGAPRTGRRPARRS